VFRYRDPIAAACRWISAVSAALLILSIGAWTQRRRFRRHPLAAAGQ
jgi:hypothetical protein